MKKILFSILLATGLINSAYAINFSTQSGFDSFSDDAGAASLYRAVAPADPLGTTGFDIAVEATQTTIDGTTVIIPKLKIQKGLPGGLDLSGYYTTIPTSQITGISSDGVSYAVALSYAIMKGEGLKPALAIRGSYSTLDIPSVAAVNTTGVDLTISKTLPLIAPYAGIGMVNMSSTDNSGNGNSAYSGQSTRYFVGANLNLKIMDIAFESGKTGNHQATTVKVGFRF